MTLTRALARVAVTFAMIAALLALPVVRAFARASSFPSRAASLSAPQSGGDCAVHAHRAPRLRRPKPALAVAPSSAGPVLPIPSSARRAAPAAARAPTVVAVTGVPDHPPA